ncbi:MAG: GIY-YIG nuclease family protein [Firmicutes bacterium]|nr:GIY-YIG nuclease family protein [Bacillota bacterium]
MYSVYIITNKAHTVLYIGMTNDIDRRIYEHKNHAVPSFSDKYNLGKLIYVESTPYVNNAIAREKQLKRWSRAKKEALINELNPQWLDLSEE